MMTQRCLNADDDDAYAETTNDPCTTTLVGGRVYNQNSIAASAPPYPTPTGSAAASAVLTIASELDIVTDSNMALPSRS